MAITTVSTSAGLLAALKSAHPGDTIQLAAGNYSGVVINNTHFASAVTITSANPLHEAVLVGLKVDSSSGLNFNKLELTAVGSTDPYYAFRVASSQNINFTNLNVHGDPEAAASTQLTGFYVSASSNISFTNSSFSHLWGAITANNDTNVDISNNTFSYLDKGGVEMGGSSNVDIMGNQFTDFQVGVGIHADAIQLYTAGTTTIASNIVITGNTVERGTGNAIQGVFVQDEVGTLPYHNLIIDNNTILGEMWNSIYVHANVTGTLQVENNLVESWSGIDMGSSTATTLATTSFLGRISLLGDFSGAAVTETGNTAQGYLATTGAIPTPTGNVSVGAVAALTGVVSLSIPVVATAETASVVELQTVTGGALAGDSGNGLYLADVGVGTAGQKAVAAGSTFVGTYGTLTANPNGTYSYVETKAGLTVGQTYDDHFTTTVASSSGGATSSTLDIQVVGSGTGTAGRDTIVGGAGTETITGLGGADSLISGTGQDTFVYTSVADSAASAHDTITGFKAGDIIDLAQVDPNFHIVSAFDHHANELVITNDGNGAWDIYGDTTGSGTPNFMIHLAGATTTINASDFHI